MSSPVMGDDEAVLVAAARVGDAEAFRALWATVERRAFGLCFHLTGNRADALDALQNAQIAVWKGLPAFEGRAPFAAWVLVVARNAALSVLRHRSNREEPLFSEAAEPVAAERGFDETVAEMLDLRQALAALPPAHRDALLLWAGGLTYEQTAAVLQVPLNTVKVWIFRARGRLRELLG
ncbi:RNA polymerase sigma factor [Microbispora sp. H11081]|uniref:RNA polymerase sigma factor n=1 Tax=Microbispora sp. H11081 TaxID=2729107 RepID=UPI0014746CD4|nr:RNA polymerase sigma factor [Microbispora sp. H11081]